ncbi:MAG: desulfoferrodoxin family protein [Bacteroidales bacterium]|nr:desulfoferrodoxin family protein [Bacteroidales bacterium]
MKARFYKCPICGNVFAVIEDSGVVPVCCGKPMQMLDAMTQDGAAEKHVPVVTRQQDGTLMIEVGSLPHPMTPEHHICFIAVETSNSLKIIHLDPTQPAEAAHCDCCETVIAVYEYCNLHGLWTTTITTE